MRLVPLLCVIELALATGFARGQGTPPPDPFQEKTSALLKLVTAHPADAKKEAEGLLQQAVQDHDAAHQVLCYNVIFHALRKLAMNGYSHSPRGGDSLNEEIIGLAPAALSAMKESDASLPDGIKIHRFFLNELGNAHLQLGRYAQAKKAYSEGLTFCFVGEGPPREAFWDEGAYFHNLANIAEQEDDTPLALDLLGKARSAYRTAGSDRALVRTCTAIAQIRVVQSRYILALESLNAAAEVCPRLGTDDRDVVAAVHKLFGNVYHYLGQLDAALEHYEIARGLYLGSGQFAAYAYVLADESTLYGNVREFDKARELAIKVLGLAKFAGAEEASDAEFGLGYLDFASGHFADSKLHFENALRLAEKLKDETRIAWCQGGVAIAMDGLGRGAEALPLAQASMVVLRKSSNLKALVIGHGMYAWTLDESGKYPEAEAEYLGMLKGLEDLSDQVVDPSDIGNFQQTLPNPYGHYARFLAQRGRPWDALGAIERGKARGLCCQIALNGEGGLAGKLTGEDRKMLEDASDTLNTANATVRSLEASADQHRGDASFAKRLDAARTAERDAELKFKRVKYALVARNPVLDTFLRFAQNPPGRRDLEVLAQKHKDTAYIEWSMIDQSQTLLTVLDKSGSHAWVLEIGEPAIAALIKRWRAAIASPSGMRRATSVTALPSGEAESAVAAEVYKKLLAPAGSILARPEIKRLVFVCDGQLGEIPLSAMIDGTKHRLIARFATSQAVSLGALTLPVNQLDFTKTALCVADTTGDDAVVRVVAPGSGRANRAEPGPLKEARQEGEAVREMFASPVSLPGARARESVVKGIMQNFGVLHFACHGSLNTTNNMRTGLVLAAQPSGDVTEDGILEAREVVAMSLRAKLAVLSACETGRGKFTGGDGIQSLAWAFQAGGCPCVVASHWQVDDSSTRELMIAFYKNLKRNMRKDDAMQAAVRALTIKYPGVYWWGAFEVIGDTSPLPAGVWGR